MQEPFDYENTKLEVAEDTLVYISMILEDFNRNGLDTEPAHAISTIERIKKTLEFYKKLKEHYRQEEA